MPTIQPTNYNKPNQHNQQNQPTNQWINHLIPMKHNLPGKENSNVYHSNTKEMTFPWRARISWFEDILVLDLKMISYMDMLIICGLTIPPSFYSPPLSQYWNSQINGFYTQFYDSQLFFSAELKFFQDIQPFCSRIFMALSKKYSLTY